MCAGSESKVLNEEVSLYMGYYGGNISVGDKHYNVKEDEGNVDAGEMIKILSSYSSDKLAELIIDLVNNSEE